MKRGVKMGLMLAALAALLGGYGLMQNMGSGTKSVSEAAGSFPLWAQGEDVTALRWQGGEQDYAFVRGQSVWQREGDAAFPVNQTALENLAEAISGLTATRQLSDVGDAADYGLDEPVFSVTAADADGGEVTFAMGDATPFADGYYLSVSGDDAVYVIEQALSDTFDRTLAQLAVMQDMPAVENVTRVTAGDGLDIACDAVSSTWRDSATGEVLDAQLAQALADDALALTWSNLIATSATDEELAAWQLDDAQATVIAIYDGEQAARTLLIGGEDEAGDRYARLPGSGMVYTIYGPDVDAVLGAGVDTLWEKTPVRMQTDEITGAAFTWTDGQRVLTDADMESETAQAILTQLTALEGTARATLDISQNAPVLTVVLEGRRQADAEATGGETVNGEAATGGAELAQTIEIYAYNVDAYYIEIAAGSGMLIDAGDVDKLIRMLRQEG